MVSSAALSGAMFNIAPPHLRGAATRGTPRFLRFLHMFSLSLLPFLFFHPRRSLTSSLFRSSSAKKNEQEDDGGEGREGEGRASVYTNQILAPFVRSYSAYGDSKRCPHLRRVVNKFRRMRSRAPRYARDCDKGLLLCVIVLAAGMLSVTEVIRVRFNSH